jgi:primosomal replication protein N
MASFNRVILMGNLTRDPELRTLPNSDTQVCDFALAVNRKWRDANGNEQEEVLFIDCAAFGRTGQTIGENLTKGRPIHIEGRLKFEQWEQDDGHPPAPQQNPRGRGAFSDVSPMPTPATSKRRKPNRLRMPPGLAELLRPVHIRQMPFKQCLPRARRSCLRHFFDDRRAHDHPGRQVFQDQHVGQFQHPRLRLIAGHRQIR